MKPTKDQIREYVKNRLIDYITSKPDCNLDWIKRKIKLSGISPEDLLGIFMELKTHIDNKEFKVIFDICCDADFDCDTLK